MSGGDEQRSSTTSTVSVTTEDVGNEKSRQREVVELPRPYKWYCHPEKTWYDIFVSFIFGFFMVPFYKFKDYPYHPTSKSSKASKDRDDNEKAMEFLFSIRKKLIDITEMSLRDKSKCFHKWASAYQQKQHQQNQQRTASTKEDGSKSKNSTNDDGDGEYIIVRQLYEIARRKNILKEWGIVKANGDDELHDIFACPSPNVAVQLYYPVRKDSDILKKHYASKKQNDDDKNTSKAESNTAETEEFGFVSSNTSELSLPKGAPLIVYFHSGAMVVGDAMDECSSEYVARLVSGIKHGNGNKSSRSSSRHVILASVQYRLAPEHPFPASVIDSLSALSHFFENKSFCDGRDIHIVGVSAGANLAAVSAMECQRTYCDNGKKGPSSAFIIAPMLNPNCDSLSYYMNSTSSHGCPVDFLHWCWGAYLGMETTTTDKNTTTPTTLDELLAANSLRDSYRKSKWRGSQYERLINPVVDIPKNFRNHGEHGAMRFLVYTSRADPFMNEDFDLVEVLKQTGAYVRHVNTVGTHVIGLMLDDSALTDLINQWRNIIYNPK